MENDYQDHPVNSPRGRVSTWIAILLVVLVLGLIAWFTIGHSSPGDARHESLRAVPGGVVV